MSERVDWRFEQDRRRCSGPVLVAWPRPDVRRWRSRRGSKHQAKAQGRPFHPGATGERQIGRVKNLNLWLMSRYGQLRRWDAVAGHKDWPLGSGRRWLGSPLSWEEHRRPRDTGGTHPGRSSCVRNAVTPLGSGRSCPVSRPRGRPNSRRESDDREAKCRQSKDDRKPGHEWLAPPLAVSHNWPDTGSCPDAKAC